MAKQLITIGTPGVGGGDPAHLAFKKINDNTTELYDAAIPDTEAKKAQARANLGLGTAAAANLTNSVIDNTPGRVLRVGDFGLGGVGRTYSLAPMEFSYINTIFGWAAPGGYPANMTEYMQGIQWAWGTNSTVWQLMGGLNNNNLVFRKGANGTWGTAFIIRHSGNTTVDSNGFIKNASPIIELHANHLELNEEAEEQPITFEKLGTGDYLIKGSNGFAQEGWYIETPKDANGNVLFSVIYTTLENGDISVKTYKKKFDLETASIVADFDHPVDIAENRWIDLRLQETPQPEIEMPESISPQNFQPTNLAQAVTEALNNGFEQ